VNGGDQYAGCAHCSSRHKGLCDGVEDHDGPGEQALGVARAPARAYAAGEVIYWQGDASEHIFNLISGWVALRREIVDGRRQIIRFLLPGGSFGIELARSGLGHTAVCLTPCRVCPIERSTFDKLRHQGPSLNERLLLMLEYDSRRAMETLAMLGLGRASERVGALMCELAFRVAGGTPLRPGVALRMPLSRTQIAEATGMTAVHVSRVLRHLRETGVFELRGGELTVIDPEKMREFAELAFEPAAPSMEGPCRPSNGVSPPPTRAIHGARSRGAWLFT
jgi:CRP/FNR family transcriptional regulator, anaerobic regulatory protein